MSCFLTTGIDYLVLHDTWCQEGPVPPGARADRQSVRRRREHGGVGHADGLTGDLPDSARPEGASPRYQVALAGAGFGSGLSCRFDQEM